MIILDDYNATPADPEDLRRWAAEIEERATVRRQEPALDVLHGDETSAPRHPSVLTLRGPSGPVQALPWRDEHEGDPRFAKVTSTVEWGAGRVETCHFALPREHAEWMMAQRREGEP